MFFFTKVRLAHILFVLLYVAQTLYAGHSSTNEFELCQPISQEMTDDFQREDDFDHDVFTQFIPRDQSQDAYNMQSRFMDGSYIFDNMKDRHTHHVNWNKFEQANYANDLLHTDPQISAIKDSVDRQLSQLSDALRFGKTFECYEIVKQLEKLVTSFDSYCQNLQQQHQKINQVYAVDPIGQGNLYAAQCLRQQLHNVLDSIKLEFFHKKTGVFLDKPHYKSIKDLIKYYKNGDTAVILPADPKRLQLIENHPFNKAIDQLYVSLKQGNLDHANKLCAQFASNKTYFDVLSFFKALSKDLNVFGMPKIWQSHPNWPVYKQELKADPGKRDAIIQTLQGDHNKALSLCERAAVHKPTAQQLNRAHQLYQYQKDPSFLKIASQGLQDAASFEQTVHLFEQRANTLECIREVVAQNSDSMLLLKEHINDLLPFNRDPQLVPIVNEMIHNPDAISDLKDRLFCRDLYVKNIREHLECIFFPEHAEQIAYQLSEVHSDYERIEIFNSLSIDHIDLGVQRAYQAFFDTKTHLPKIFDYDQQLKKELPICLGTQEFTQERKLYIQVMVQPIACHAQFMQAQQCISFFKDACVPQEVQAVYRDLACTAAQTYLHQSYNSSSADRMQQMALFDHAHRAIGQGDITPADISVQSTKVAEEMHEQHALINYQQLHEMVAQKCAAHQEGVFASYYQSREHALKHIVEGNNAIYKQTYKLSSQAEKILEKNGFDPAQFKTCTGNLLQQDTNAKFVQTLNALAQKPARTEATQLIKEGVLECAQAGSQLNQNGKLKEAMLLADYCHVAIEYLWHGLDAGLEASKGVADGIYAGVSSEIARAFRDPYALQETSLIAGSCWTEPGLRDQVAMETATIVSDLVRLIKDSGEIVFSGVAGVGDAVLGFPELVSNCLEVTKLTGQCIGRISMEIAMIIDAAEREDVATFERYVMNTHHTCGQVAQGVNDYLAQLKACKHNYNGKITKADLKELARFSGRFVTEGIILSNILKGSTKILKGAAHYVQSAESTFTQLQHIKDLSGAQVRNVLLNAHINLSSPVQQIPKAHEFIERVLTRSTLAPEGKIASVAQALEENLAKSIIQQGEASSSTSLAQKVGQYLSLEPKPGFILISGVKKNEFVDANENIQLWEQLHDAKSVEEQRDVFLQVEDIKVLEKRVKELNTFVSDNRPGEFYDKLAPLKIAEFEEKLPILYDQIRTYADDVSKISKNTNIPEHIIQRIKEHLFLKEHIIDDAVKRFDPQIDILQSWMRLMDGNYVQSDLRLLQHELAESFLMQDRVQAYGLAHNVVDQVYNWVKFLK